MSDVIKLNEKLVKEKNLSKEDILIIKGLHKKLKIVSNSPEDFHNPVEVISSIETVLQVMWGFPTNKRFHKYALRIKGCTCADMDTNELYGTGLRWSNGNCPWHDTTK